MSTTILESRQLEKKFSIDGEETQVLYPTSLQVQKGEFVVISGSSGSGKSTLLTLLSGLDTPSAGKVLVADKDITALSEDDLASVRNEFTGFVFQAFYLIPSLSAFENVMFPAELRGDKAAAEKSEKLLKRVGLWKRRNSYPSQLSGGEKQRVAICRALINDPAIVFADEPTGNLDSGNSDEIIRLISELHQERNTTFLLATHSREISSIADRVLHIHDGKVEESVPQGS